VTQTLTTTITATVAGISGSAAVTVRQPTAARVSIQKVTVGCPAVQPVPPIVCGLNTPVDQAAVVGQIDVTIDVDPGDFIAQKVVLLVDNVPVDSQSFTAQQSMDLTNAHAFGGDIAAAVASTVIPFNTAKFNTTTGAVAPINLNGQHTVSARLTVTAGGAGGSANPSLQLTWANPNTYLANLTLGGTTGSATGADGLAYRRGSLTVNVLPVIYTPGGVTMASGSVTFGSATCDVSTTNSARTASLTAGSATFAQTGTAGAGNVVDYEYGNGACTAPETVLLNATDSQGNPLFAVAAPSPLSSPGIRLDNLAPAQPVVFENPNSRSGGWVNDAVSFVTVQGSGAAANGMISAAVPDAGVGGVSYAAKAAITTSIATAAAAPDITNPSSLALSLANAVCVVYFAQDALGNRSGGTTGGAGTCDADGNVDNNTTIGIDRAPPIVVYDATSLADLARINTATIAADFVLAVTDTGTGGIGVSGAIPSLGNVLRRDAANAAACQVGSGSSCAQTAMTQVAVGLYRTNINAVATSGYFTFSGTGRDAAGNTTAAPATRVIVHDAVLPALSPVSVSLANNFYNGGTGQSFSSFANDDLDAWKVDHEVSYAALIPNIFYGTTVVNTFNATPLLNSNVPVSFTVPFFYRQMQLVTAQGTCAGTPVTVSAQTKPDAIVATLFDQANNNPLVSPVNTPIPSTSVVTGSNTAYPGTMCLWSDSVSATTIGDGTASPGTTPRTVTVFANAIGPTLAFNPVFTRVDFYYAVGGRMTLIGTATTPATTDPNAQGFRQHRYSISWTPGTAHASGGMIYAIGSTANGDALATPASGAITIQP
jgi:hypothetical protein